MSRYAILLIEDNPYDVDLTLKAFKNNDIHQPVIVAQDGEEALDYLFGHGKYEGREVADLPQIVFLDLNMPKVNGFEVLEAIRGDDRTKLLPVVVLTSSSDTRDREESYCHGANSYVQKPIDFVEFNDTIKQLSNYWLVINLHPQIK